MKDKNMTLNDIIIYYNNILKNMDNDACLSQNYGGYLRGNKGILLEKITKDLLSIAVDELNLKNITIDSKKEKLIDCNSDYYNFSIDVQVKYNNHILITVEDKNYCDISMFKRVIIDSLIAQQYQNVGQTFLLQFEDSMNNKGIGNNIQYSSTVNFLLNFLKNDKLKILTLLEGQRKSTKPINKIEFFKELHYNVLYNIKEEFKKSIKEEYDKFISR